ncbi:MAG: Lon protease family protein [Desulfovibrio sp.]|uniref:Lon protease family protein n=1 Tax=Desulfovibrio sp. 7SRBS1 TaxID=3378064 RepID=UPI003B403BAA
MSKLKPLPSGKLRLRLDPERIKYEDSTRIPHGGNPAGQQPRATHAFELGLHIKGGGYHIFVSGETGLGRTYFVRSVLEKRARKNPTPPDWLYVENFEDTDRPMYIELPAGKGRQFRHDLNKTVTGLREDIHARLEEETFQKEQEGLIHQFKTWRENVYSQMEDEARKEGFSLNIMEEGNLTLTPVLNGKPVSQDEFDQLDNETRKSLRHVREGLLTSLTTLLRRIQVKERRLKVDEEDLERKMVTETIDEHLAPLREKYQGNGRLEKYLKMMRDDILENLVQFTTREDAAPQPGQEPHHGSEEFFSRYRANLFVDNSAIKGAPLIVDDHPTFFNLLGCIERESELGAMYTDYSLIKAGSLHKANHGYLVLDVADVLSFTGAWEGLLRALRSQLARVEDPSDQDQVRTRTVEPEPIPLDLKVILIGSEEAYETLLYHDSRFSKLFRIKAHMQDTTVWNAANIRQYMRELGEIVRDDDLLPFSRCGLAALVDFGSRLAEDQRKLSLEFPQLRDLMIEASAMASIDGQDMVDARTIDRAQSARDFRANLYEEEFMADYDSEIIKAPTSGLAVGRVNGLAVTYYGDYAFALPHQIACTVGVGEGGVIDLEREAQLGGPIHTKAMMILKSFLLGQFAHNKPLVMAGSLYFEQSYAHVEGDSASGAELAALLSALADVPIDLSYAFTGAVNQSGTVMAVGDVTRKVEGFYEVCRRRGLTGNQGVLLPADNVVNLVLKPEVLRAVDEGLFAVYPVKTIGQALEILTGLKPGTRRKDGTFTRGSLFDLADRRLLELGRRAHTFRKK